MPTRLVLPGLVLCVLAGCRCDPTDRPAEPSPPPPAAAEAEATAAPRVPPAPGPTGRPDWAAIRAAEAQCADCHPDEVDAWRRSPMGHSLARLDAALAESLAGPEPVEVRHPETGERFTVQRADEPGGPLAFAEVDGARFAASHVVGSGSHTRSFLRVADGEAALMPLTWYASTDGWAMSPGYAVPDHPGFHRRMNLECLTCHGDPAAVAPGTDDVFVEALPGAIGCARCHGDGRAHVEARLAGRAAPMVRPEALDPALGADVCGQCHLQGAVRLLRAGRSWDHALPGRPLGETVAVFARATAGSDVGIASHAERLRRSRCAQVEPEAGRCTTCHTPHPTGPARDRSAACRGCHVPDGTGSHATTHATRCAGPAGDDCAGCHMAHTPTHDIPHVAMTDHFIRVRPEAADRPAADEGPLVWINRPPGVAEREATLLLGRAWAESARARVSSADRDRARALLEPALTGPDARPDDDPAAWADLSSMRQLAGDGAGALEAMEQAVRRSTDAPGVPRARWWAALADLRLMGGDLPGATAAAERARALRPGEADDRLLDARLALARGDADGVRAALAAYDRARPGRGESAQVRGAMALAAFDPAGAEAAYAEAAAREPGDARAWLALCRVRADRARWDAAAEACARAAALARGAPAVARVAGARARVHLGRGEPRAAAELAAAAVAAAPADAAYVLGRLALDADRVDDALGLLDRAVQLEPTMGAAWAALAEVLRRRGEVELADRAAAQAARLSGR